MKVPRVEYMYWAKTVPRVTYNLAGSGAPNAAPEEYGAEPQDLSAEELGPYGHPQLVAALAARYGVGESSLVLVPGASMGNYLALVAALEPGDTVLLEAPNYECLPRAVELFGGRVELFERHPSQRWAPDLTTIEDGLRRGARAVLISNLHNPSGLRLEDRDLNALLDLTDRHGATLIIDEVYLDYLHVNKGAKLHTAASLGPHLITTNSLTKVYGLGGLRAGWLMAAPETAERVCRAMDHLVVNNASPSMNLAIRALGHIKRLEARTRRLYQQGWPVTRQWLEARPDLSCPGNDGALFVFVNLGPGLDAQRLLDRLVQAHDTLVAPGRFFGRPDYVRVSFALPPEQLREALSRLGQAIDETRRS